MNNPKYNTTFKAKPKTNDYGSADYWEERYVKCMPEERFDWLEDHSSIL